MSSSRILIGVAAAVAAAALGVVLYVQIDRAGDLQAGLDQLKKDYTEMAAARGRLATEKEAVERDRNGWRDRAEKAERESSEVQARAAETARLLQAEQQAHEKTRNGLAALGREVTAAQAGIGDVMKERDALRSRLEKAEREAGAAQAREADTARRLQAEQQVLEKTKGDLAAAQAQGADTVRQLQAEQQALEKTRGDLAAAQAKASESEKERDSLRGRAENAEREISEARSRQADAARLLQAEQQTLEKTRGELAAARAEIGNKDLEIRRLEAKPRESAAQERQ